MVVTEEPSTDIKSGSAELPKLKPREKSFVEHYLLTHNASDSVRKAGYANKNPGAYGWQLLQKPKIKAWIDSHEQTIQREKAVNEARWSKEDYIIEAKKRYEKVESDRDAAKYLELGARLEGYLTQDTNIQLNLGLINISSGEITKLSNVSDWQTLRDAKAKTIQAQISHSHKSNDTNSLGNTSNVL